MKTLARERDRAEILRRLRTLRSTSVRRWGRMSAHGMVCHLADSLRMVTGERDVSIRAGLLGRTVVKWTALYAPLRWPPGIPSSPELDQLCGGTPPSDFASDLAKVEALLETVTAPDRRLEQRQHPMFGSMSNAAWLRWGYLHMDHHLRQFGA